VAQVEREESDLPLSVQAELLSISRSSLYYQPRPPSSEEIRIKHRIDELYTDYPFYGSRRMTAQLQREGMEINRKAVQRHMRGLSIDHPNHVWGIDITSIPMQRGWMYLVALLDWYSRYVLSWEVDMTLELPFVLSTVKLALAQAVPIICNSDQGSHFTSPHYGEVLRGAKVQISMDGKGRALDNIFTERLWRSVKYEEVYLHEYTSPKEARSQLQSYFEFYNHKRLHQALEYQTPAEVYFQKREEDLR